MIKRLLFLILISAALLAVVTACTSGTTTTVPATSSTTTAATTTPPPSTTPTTTTPSATTTTPPTSTTPANDIAADAGVAFKMVDFLYNMEAIQNYYDDGVSAMASFEVELSKSARSLRAESNIPREFRDKLPPGGA
ncbi:MAG: hypothetical protein JXA17_06985, partial [Dehalococcoidales bacterium]|nr:hypothetical protein [Dehalococcoidales bacterium]